MAHDSLEQMARLSLHALQKLLCTVCLLWLMPTGWAHGVDLVVERAWLEDPGGQMRWEEVQNQAMVPLEGVLSRGFGTAPVWMRLRIDPSQAGVQDTRQLYLRIRPMYLDEIVLFDPLQQPAQRQPVGDRYSVSTQAEPATTFLYVLPVGNGPRNIWLRLQTSSTRLLYADVFTPADFRWQDAHINHFGAIYLSLIAMFFLWGLIQALIRPDALMVSFLFYQGHWLVMGACFLGYPYLYASADWPPGTVDQFTNTLVVLTTASVVVFSHFVLNELGRARWRRNAMTLVFATFPLLLLGIWGGWVSAALRLNMLLVLLVPLLMWLLSLISKTGIPNERRKQHRGLSKPVVVGYFSLTLVFTLLTALPALGLVQAVELSLYVVLFYSLSSGVLMVMMLQYRAWKNLRQQTELRAMAHDAKARADQEQTHREERERLLAMLGHELKTPLATMRMLLANKSVPDEVSHRIGASVTDMAHVVELAVQSGQMEAGRISLTPQSGQLQPLIQTVCRELAEGERVLVDTRGNPDFGVITDLQLLKVVVRNLLDNALKYSAPQTPVQVVLRPPDVNGNWGLTVSNAIGRAGLPDAHRLFEKYYRSPRASHRSGSGLGLYVVRGLVQVMGGQLRYEPLDDCITFTLTLQSALKEHPG